MLILVETGICMQYESADMDETVYHNATRTTKLAYTQTYIFNIYTILVLVSGAESIDASAGCSCLFGAEGVLNSWMLVLVVVVNRRKSMYHTYT